jgi:hypothetical protein
MRLAVVEEGLERIRDKKVRAPIEDERDQARAALNGGDTQACDAALGPAEKLTEEALDRIDLNDPKFVVRHQAVLELIDSLPRTGPAYRKLQLVYLDSLKLAEAQDYDACDKALKPLEEQAKKEAAALVK